MMGWYHNGVGWGGWLVMVVGMVAFWGTGGVGRYRDLPQYPAPVDRHDATAHRDPLDILDQRFARGEIDETEYRARADVLRAAVH